MPEVIEQPQKNEAKPYAGKCCVKCYTAKSDKKRCRCKCHGRYHGLGRKEGAKNEKDKS